MEKKRFLNLILLGMLLTKSLSVSAAEMVFDEPKFVREKYTGQSSIVCKGKKYKIPSYFPFVNKHSNSDKSDLYLGASEAECSDWNLHIFLGFGKDCRGQHFCTDSSFSSSYIGEPSQSRLYSALSAYTKELELGHNKVGYFAPPQCGAYCDEAKIIWFTSDRVYIVGLKTAQDNQATINELIKSANSYINQGE